MRTPLRLVLLGALCGCTGPEEADWADKPGEGGTTATTGSTTTSTGGTASTTTTGTTPYTPPDCTGALATPPFQVSTIDIATEEDFDFDLDGFIVFQDGDLLAKNPTTGETMVVAAGVSGDPSGLQVNSANDLVVVSGHDSTIHLMYRTGGSEIIMSGFGLPNGLEIGANDRVYATDMADGQVRWIDPDTEVAGLVTGQLSSPDNLVLSPDEQTMYVATRDGIAVLNRTPGTDDWDPVPTFLAQSLGWLYVIEIDSCGNLYTASGTTIYRLDMTNLTIEAIAEMPTGSFVSSIRFGNGRGEFDRTQLYVTMRLDIHYFDVGIEGKRSPTSP